jgi:hypothetical protein
LTERKAHAGADKKRRLNGEIANQPAADRKAELQQQLALVQQFRGEGQRGICDVRNTARPQSFDLARFEQTTRILFEPAEFERTGCCAANHRQW